MRKISNLLPGILAFSLVGGTFSAQAQTVLPTKLYPYETQFDKSVFKERRDELMRRLPDNSIVFVTTTGTYLRNGDVNYEFRPASTFYYLTGFEESAAVALIRTDLENPAESELILFVPQRNALMEKWLGEAHGPDDAIEIYGADEAHARRELDSMLGTYLGAAPYESVFANLRDNPNITNEFNNADGVPLAVMRVEDIVNEMRALKSPMEIEAIRRAVQVSVQAFSEAIKVIEPDMYEYEVDALFDYVLRVNGTSRAAYPTIVASGPNVNALHYEANQRQMLDGDLVMIDFGAEYGLYAADVTRTLPVNGKFSNEQATLYNIVLEAHRAVLDATADGVRFRDLYVLQRDIILDRMIEKGIITGAREEIISSNQFRQYIPAGLGHPVGLDVHDPFTRDGILHSNMVIAFEPHIYLYEDDETVDPAYWGVCARIEDDVLITETGIVNLSADLPWEIEEIEAMMRQAQE